MFFCTCFSHKLNFIHFPGLWPSFSKIWFSLWWISPIAGRMFWRLWLTNPTEKDRNSWGSRTFLNRLALQLKNCNCTAHLSAFWIRQRVCFRYRFSNFSKPLSQTVVMVLCCDWRSLETSVMLLLDIFAGFATECFAIPSRITERTRWVDTTLNLRPHVLWPFYYSNHLFFPSLYRNT